MSLASMLRLTAELREHYQLGDPEDPSADILFVNADEPEALSRLRAFMSANKSLRPIMLSSSAKQVDGEITITKPLVFKRVKYALQLATESPRQMPSEEVGAVASGTTKKILVVDDSYPVRKYMEQKIPLLCRSKIDLAFAASGEEAISKVKEDVPDLVFLDVMMPGVDGYKVCKWIKSIKPTTQVAMLTSRKSPFDKVRGAMSGCNDYLIKPPVDDKLEKILAQI